jgi:hypothetical protein
MPGILALADPNRLRELFAQAGFSEPSIEEVSFAFRFADADDYWEFFTGARRGIAMVLGRLEEDERTRIRTQVAEEVASFDGSDGIELPAASLVVSAS